jgi:NRPS condensation-like uncharacterized protein
MGKNCTIPLIRVKVLYSENKFDLILTMQHVIADGMSMAFLLRDILEFYINPQKKYKTYEIVKETENILPLHYQNKIPQKIYRFNLISSFYKFLKFLNNHIKSMKI